MMFQFKTFQDFKDLGFFLVENHNPFKKFPGFPDCSRIRTDETRLTLRFQGIPGLENPTGPVRVLEIIQIVVAGVCQLMY